MQRSIIAILIIFGIFNVSFAQAPGDDCSDPIPVEISSFNDIPIFLSDQTCGRGNFASNTCMGTYDGGEDIFYEITVDLSIYICFTLDPQGTTWTAMALSADCPPSGSVYGDCIAFSRSSDDSPHKFGVDLDPGVYYLMIDTWPAPECIPSFELSITDCWYDDYMTCLIPYEVWLFNDTVFLDEHEKTCSYDNDYSETCLGSYDSGDDIIYEIFIERSGEAIFHIDPHGTTHTGIALGTSCPPSDAGAGQCLASSTEESAEPHGFTIDLEEGVYYLIVDTWPAPDCIPDFDLSINFTLHKICGDVNDDMQINVSDAVYIINYVFIGGEPPVIQDSGDTNCDQNTNVSDAVWIINHIFIGGNPPCDIDGDSELDC
jgi:hypothetical protein